MTAAFESIQYCHTRRLLSSRTPTRVVVLVQHSAPDAWLRACLAHFAEMYPAPYDLRSLAGKGGRRVAAIWQGSVQHHVQHKHMIELMAGASPGALGLVLGKPRWRKLFRQWASHARMRTVVAEYPQLPLF